MNFKAMAYKIISKMDTVSAGGFSILSKVFPAFCLFFATHGQPKMSAEFKKDLSWLLWVILQKHKNARSCLKIIQTLLFLGADPEFKLLPSLPSIKDLLNNLSKLSSQEAESLKRIFQTTMAMREISVEIDQLNMQGDNDGTPQICPQFDSKLLLTAKKKQDEIVIEFSTSEAPVYLLTHFLWLGYTNGAEILLQQYPIATKQRILMNIVLALVPTIGGVVLIDDDATRASNLRFIAEHSMPKNERDCSTLYAVINNSFQGNRGTVGIAIQTLLNLSQTNRLEIFKALLCGNFEIDFTTLQKSTKSRDLFVLLLNLMTNVIHYSSHDEFTLTTLRFIKRNHGKYFPILVVKFWEHIINKCIIEKEQDKRNIATLIASLLKEVPCSEQDIIKLLASACLKKSY